MASPRLTVFEAIAAYALAVMLMVGLSPLLYAHLGLFAMAPIQLVLIAGPAVLLAVVRSGGPNRMALHGLGLRPARWRAVAGGALVGASFWYLNLALVAPIAQRYLGGQKLAEQLENTILDGHVPLWVTIVMVAVFPAVCEEVLLRGAVARALVPRLGAIGAVLLSAFLFGAMHLHPAQALTTFVFGLVLGYAAIATDSVWPAVAMHLGNNALVLLVGGEAIPAVTASLRSSPSLWLPIAGILSVSGCLLIRSRPDRARRHST